MVLNRCSVTNETKDGKIKPDSDKYEVEFNYEFLEDFRDDEEDSNIGLLDTFKGYVCIRVKYV